MLDFSYLFVIFLIVLAVQANQPVIAVAIFVLLIITSKSKYMTAAAVVGGLVAIAYTLGFQDPIVIGIGLFIVLLLIVKNDPAGGAAAGPQGYYPGG